MKTLRWAKYELIGAFKSLWEFVKNYHTAIMAFSSAMFAGYVLLTAGNEFYIQGAVWILINIFVMAGAITKQQEEDERRKKLSGRKRITKKDAAGNYSINESDIHKAIFLLGQFEDSVN